MAKGQKKSLGDFKSLIDKLNTYRDRDDEMLPSKDILKGVLAISHDAATCHRAYNHYTTLDKFEKIFGAEGGPSFLLGRLTSVRLNDHNECDKYAKYQSAAQTYVLCLNHDGAECANLWWLYAQGDPLALRITFPAKEFCRWCEDLRKNKSKGVDVADVVYAAVRGTRDDYQFDRQNTLSWEDQRVCVENLRKLINRDGLVGRVKDYEWRYERETRIIVWKNKKNTKGVVGDRFFKLKIPDDLVAKMRITTSPWVSDWDYKEIQRRVVTCLEGRWKLTARNFRPSVLERAMDALSKSKT